MGRYSWLYIQKMWDKNYRPCPNGCFNKDVRAWMGSYIPNKTMNVIANSSPNTRQFLLVTWTPFHLSKLFVRHISFIREANVIDYFIDRAIFSDITVVGWVRKWWNNVEWFVIWISRLKLNASIKHSSLYRTIARLSRHWLCVVHCNERHRYFLRYLSENT